MSGIGVRGEVQGVRELTREVRGEYAAVGGVVIGSWGLWGGSGLGGGSNLSRTRNAGAAGGVAHVGQKASAAAYVGICAAAYRARGYTMVRGGARVDGQAESIDVFGKCLERPGV